MENYIDSLEQLLKKDAKLVDLSYTLQEGMPVWPTHVRYGTTVYENQDWGYVSFHRAITLGEHSGTHIDAPRHFFKDGKTIDQVGFEHLMGRGVKIEATNVPPRGKLSLEQIKQFEAENGEIREGDIIMIRFGWEDKFGVEPNTHDFLNDWPGLSKEGAEYFLSRKVAAVGCDALALDPFGCEVNESHNVLLGNDIPIIENITNLKDLPVFTYVIGLPNKFKDGSGSPIRMVAIVA